MPRSSVTARGSSSRLAAHLASVGELVELATVFVDGHHVHLTDEVARTHVDPDEGISAVPHPRPADRLVLLAALGVPDIAVGHERVGEFVAAVALQLAGLKVVPWPAAASDRVVDGDVGFWVDDPVV